jgi:maltose/moltooligosaccharide transporter
MLTNWFHPGAGAAGYAIPLTVRLSFYIGAAVFLAAVLWTIATAKEYPPDDMEAFRRMKAEERSLATNAAEILDSIAIRLLPCKSSRGWGLFCMWLYFLVAVARDVFAAPDTASPI